jgi:hypothetical protein
MKRDSRKGGSNQTKIMFASPDSPTDFQNSRGDLITGALIQGKGQDD